MRPNEKRLAEASRSIRRKSLAQAARFAFAVGS